MEIFTLPHLGTNWCFIDDVLFYQDEGSGRLRRFHTFDSPIERLYCRPFSGDLRVILEDGEVNDVIVDPARGPQHATLMLVEKS